jgi:hypothetical protein
MERRVMGIPEVIERAKQAEFNQTLFSPNISSRSGHPCCSRPELTSGSPSFASDYLANGDEFLGRGVCVETARPVQINSEVTTNRLLELTWKPDQPPGPDRKPVKETSLNTQTENRKHKTANRQLALREPSVRERPFTHCFGAVPRV